MTSYPYLTSYHQGFVKFDLIAISNNCYCNSRLIYNNTINGTTCQIADAIVTALEPNLFINMQLTNLINSV